MRARLKTRVKIMKDEKVVDSNFTKGKIYEIKNSDFFFYYICNDLGVLCRLSKDLFENVEEEKVEQVKIVRRLEDLDGLENGMGLMVCWCEVDKCLEIYFKSRFIDRVFNIDKIEVLKAMGFKFEYKPLRTEEEVKKEIMSLESLPFTREKVNYYVDYNDLIGKYLVICDSVNGHGLHIYMPEGLAQKYADELNKIINSK